MNRRHALILTPRAPWPLDDGGRIAMWQTVWAASREFRTTLLSLVPPAELERPAPQEVSTLGIRFRPIAHTPPPTWRAIISGLVGRWPYTLARFRNRALTVELGRLSNEDPPAFVLANHLHMLAYQGALPSIPWVYRAHNVEAAWMQSYSAGLPPGPRKWFALHQARRLPGVEARLCRHAAAILALQEEEAGALRRAAPGVRVETLPLGIDLRRFRAPSPEEPPILLLPGAFGWPPNADGALRFLREGWSRVRQRAPLSRLRLAGKDPPKVLREAAAEQDAEVAGLVPSMPEEMSRATLVLVPLWAGAGVRVKIVEAMAAGVPVVSTGLGADGLELEPGRDYLRGDDPSELAARILEVLESDSLRRRLSARGLELARSRWAIETCAARQNSICRDLLETRA